MLIALGCVAHFAGDAAIGWSGVARQLAHVAAVRPIRDETERRVRGLLAEIDLPVRA